MNYGKISALPATSGVGLLPFADNNRVLFITAIALVAVGVAVFTISAIMARKNNASN